jgi:hypothetical protein
MAMPEDGPRRLWFQRPLGRGAWPPVEPPRGQWHHLFDDAQFSPQEFYAAIQVALARREVPDTVSSEVIYREAGVFSAGRAYLRVSRENHVFDVCAAPFGRGFFVSWWLAEARPSWLWPTLAGALYLSLMLLFFAEHAAPGRALWYGSLLLLAGFLLLGALVAESACERWVQYVLVVPGLGWLLTRLFLPPTYFRRDTELMFKTSVERAVREALTSLTKAKGIREPTEEEWKPVMRNLLRR